MVVSPNLLYERLSPTTFLTAVLRLREQEKQSPTCPHRGGRKRQEGQEGGGKWECSQGTRKRKKEASPRKQPERERGKSAGELFLLTGCLLIFLH